EVSTPLPEWAYADWLRQAPMVVRRERVLDADRVPVGIRGRTRNQRIAAYVRYSAIRRRVTPESLVQNAAWTHQPQLQASRAVAALMSLAPVLNAMGLAWGPTGGTGFALASGLRVLHSDSDLDLVVRAPVPLTHAQTTALRTAFS